jgi:hypothetical protein
LVVDEARAQDLQDRSSGLRLGDQALAQDVYTDLRDQVINSPERWHDVDVDVSLSPWNAGPAAGSGSMFVATVRWEYRVVPVQSTMRFACVSSSTSTASCFATKV